MGGHEEDAVVDQVLRELGSSGPELAAGVIAAVAIYLAVILATRLSGLRSFSKMSSFDFAMTVAVGSLIASAASGQAALATATVGVLALYAAQYVVASLRRRHLLHDLVDNSPLLLMDGPRIIEENLASARVTLDDLHGKLREANVLQYHQVQAVVLETTGDISVLHGDSDLDPGLLRGVRRGAA
jgi:uncharacterized membrane protein YcaP (DUF421 family)